MTREKHKITIGTPDPGYEPYPLSIMNRSTHEATMFDPTLGKPATISYRLPKAGCIRIRIVHRNRTDLLIRTLQDWTRQDFGRYELQWDGRDASGNIVDNKKILVFFESKDRDNGLRHQSHDDEACRDTALVITTTAASLERVKGAFEIRVAFPDAADRCGSGETTDVACYIDYKPYQTGRLDPGQKEFVFKIDTAGLDDGEHLVTVNTNDRHDHKGTAGVKIRVEN